MGQLFAPGMFVMSKIKDEVEVDLVVIEFELTFIVAATSAAASALFTKRLQNTLLASHWRSSVPQRLGKQDNRPC